MSTVLIVDDQEANRYLLEVLLAGNGYQVQSAANGRQALEMAREQAPDLIVTDILMPVMDGFALCRKWKTDDTLKHVPFIFYTATYTEPKDEEFALSLGAERFVIKPTEPEVLVKIIKEVINEHEQGNLQIRRPELDDEELFLQEYNVTLVKKLEKTVDRLKEANQALRREVEERRRAEEHLRMWGQIFEHAEWGIVILDANGFTIEQMNPAFASMHAYATGDLVGRSIMDLLSPETREDFPRSLKLSRTLGHHNFEGVNLKKDESSFPVLVSATVMTDSDGGIRHWVINMLDTSRQKEAEAQRADLETQLVRAQKMEAVGAMASGIAHDFNNILGAIFGFTELALLRSSKDPELTRTLHKILNAGDRAKTLVTQILSYRRKSKRESRPVRVGPIAEEVRNFLTATVSSQTRITVDIKQDGVIKADPSQIHQVLMNLCTNACQAMGEKGGVLTVEIDKCRINDQADGQGPGLTPGCYQKITVTDNGPGITPPDLERIFEPFYSTKVSEGGSGLGLAITKGIIVDHGGSILVDSRLGQGTSFEVLLPVIDSEPGAGITDGVKEPISSGDERILFVDDEPMLVDFGRELLCDLGYYVTGTTSSMEALETFTSRPQMFDLAILDLNMPRLNGVDLAKRIHQMRPELPIMLCSGFSEQVPDEVARDSGISRYISKPMLARELSSAIRELLD